MEEVRAKQMKREQSQKKRETSKENFMQPKETIKEKEREVIKEKDRTIVGPVVVDNRTSQSKEKNNWIKPTQKPAYPDNRVLAV